MKHMLLADRLFNQPLMISEPKLNVIQYFFSQRSDITFHGIPTPVAIDPGAEEESRRHGYVVKNGVGLISIFGPLAHRVLPMEFPSGGPTSYQDIRAAFDLAQQDDSVHTIAGIFGTPGGEVHGCFDLADHIYNSRGLKPLLAIIDEQAYSAGYLLASAFDRVVIPRTGGAGSIGVIATHADFSQAESAAGVNVRHIYAGARKADFSPHQPLSQEAEAILQGMVDDDYELLTDTVARYRGMKVQAVRDTEAGFYKGAKAVVMNLADEVCAADRAIAVASKSNGARLISATAKPQATGKENKVKTIEELKEKCPDLVAQIETAARVGMVAQAEADAARTEAVAGENKRIMSLVTAAVGEDVGTRISAVAAKNLTAEDLSAMGVDLSASAGGSAQQQMLTAITEASSKGVKTGIVVAESDAGGIDTAAIYASRQKQIAG